MSVYVVNGQAIHVVEEGPPQYQTALLVHGWCSSWYALSPLLGMLSQRFHCLAVDLPGYGKSPPFPHRTTIPAYADLLAEFIRQTSDGPVVYVGHSMGGMIGLTLALKYPMLIERMVLIDPTVTGKLSTFINLFVSPVTMLERFGLGQLIVWGVERAFVGITDRLMRPASFAERSGITERDYLRLREDARRPGQGRVRAECFVAMRENDLTGRLKALRVPGLVLWGAEDNTVPLRDAGVVADEWDEAYLRILPKAGHWPRFERPDQVRRLVAAYLGLPRSSPWLLPLGPQEMTRLEAVARFLQRADLGRGLNESQRLRLASRLEVRRLAPGSVLVRKGAPGNELFIVWEGTIEVWAEEEDGQRIRLAVLPPGRMTGELAVLDQEPRTADLLAGPEGATVLALSRERLLSLAEDDAVLGTHLLLNLAMAMSQRARYILWQLEQEREGKHRHPYDFLLSGGDATSPDGLRPPRVVM